MDGTIAQVISRSGCSSGGSIQALLLAKGLKSEGENVVFVSRGGECAARAEELGIDHVTQSMIWSIPSILSFVRMVRQRKITVLHAHKGKALSFSLLASLLCGNVKVFANRGVSFSLSWSNVWKYRLPLTKGIVCVSFGIKRDLCMRWVQPERVFTVYGSLDERFFRSPPKQKARQELGLKEGFYVCLVGNFRPWKGHIILSEALKRLASRVDGCSLLFAGKEKASILQKVSSLVGECVVSLGYRRDVERVMGASDVLVNASTEGEGVPGVIREAMACGVPVVVSSLEGNLEMVRHGKNGLVFPVGDTEALFKRLLLLWKSPRLRRRLGLNGSCFAKRFTISRRAKTMLKLYRYA